MVSFGRGQSSQPGAVTRKKAYRVQVQYVPLDGKPIRLTLGLRALDPAQWIEVDAYREQELRQKMRLLADRHADVVRHVPSGDAGGRELWQLLADHVVSHFPELYRDVERDDDGIVALTDVQTDKRVDVRGLHPIDACGRLVQEDLALMRRIGGEWILVAASLCFPSRWRLSEKLGKNLSGIHGPVPRYEQEIAAPVHVMFDKITSDRPMWRLNWTLIDDAELHQPDSRRTWADAAELAAALDHNDLGDLLHFRVERQTLTKLPDSGDVVFTIRTYVRALADLGGPAEYANLAVALRSADAALIEYKGWAPILEHTLAWLDSRYTSASSARTLEQLPREPTGEGEAHRR